MVNAGWHMVGKRWTRLLCPILLGGVLAGCGDKPVGPESWWHSYEGGLIAQDRPPPPLATAPYPNFAGMPPRPKLLSEKQRDTQIAGLDEARNLSLAAAASAPLPVAAATAPKPAPQPSAQASTMTTPAATAVPPPAAPAAAAPVVINNQAPVIADIDHPPALAASPPPRVDLLGAAPTAAAGEADDFKHLSVGFANGSSVLPPAALPGLIAFAQAHPGKIIALGGHGDPGMADDQGLALGWTRAQTVAAALIAAGVPQSDLRYATHASFKGGSGTASRGVELSLVN